MALGTEEATFNAGVDTLQVLWEAMVDALDADEVVQIAWCKSKKGDMVVHFASTKHPCGRAARKKGKDIRCWDGKKGMGKRAERNLSAVKRDLRRDAQNMVTIDSPEADHWFAVEGSGVDSLDVSAGHNVLYAVCTV